MACRIEDVGSGFGFRVGCPRVRVGCRLRVLMCLQNRAGERKNVGLGR